MAKLTARGRSVVYAITREYSEAQLQAHHDKLYPEGDPLRGQSLCIWERKSKRLMSDGKILEKLDVRFRPDQFDPKGRYHSYGWKVSGTLKAGVDPARWLEIYLAPMKSGAPSPWSVDGDKSRPVQVSAARIRRALESGESVGFCQSCGHETDGVEPDARNYPCHSCGQMSVYGAEELALNIA